MQPLISILMPFRNTEAYLPECLESILDQSYQNWELIAVDDHSTDESRGILDRFALGDPRIRVVANKGKGIIPALRKSFSLSRGQMVTRMDSDDRMVRERLEKMMLQLLEHGPGHLAVGQVRYFSERGISDGYARYERWLNKLTSKGTNFSEIYKECVIPSPCWMVFREDLQKCGGFEPDRYPEDYDLCFRFYARGLICLSNPDMLHYWRDYDQRTSRNSPHYAQNYFLEIKLHYFLQLDRDAAKPLVVWGAGYKGKKIARMLKDRNVSFLWLCDNPKKIGKRIYEIPLAHFSRLDEIETPQSIVTVANEMAQEEIRSYLSSKGQREGMDFFFFC